jgi:hypothetical protein
MSLLFGGSFAERRAFDNLSLRDLLVTASRLWILCALSVVTVPSRGLAAVGTDDDPATAAGSIRVSDGVAIRSATGEATQGMDDLTLSADVFPTFVGANLALQATGLQSNLAEGDPFRIQVGPVGRLGLTHWTLSHVGWRFALWGDLLLDYQFARLPVGNPLAEGVAFRSGLLLGGRIHLELPMHLIVEASVSHTLWTSTTFQGASAASAGSEVGAALGYRIVRRRKVAIAVLVTYAYTADSLTPAASGASEQQALHRLGLALEVQTLSDDD